MSTASVVDWFAQRAQLHAQRPALWWRGRWHSYAELDARAARLAQRLHGLGVRRDDRVSILALNHIAHIDLVLAAPRLGFIYAPFNHRLPLAEQKVLVEYLRPALMLADAEHAALARDCGVALRALDDYETWLAAGDAAPLPDSGVMPDDPQMILLTGGSTGALVFLALNSVVYPQATLQLANKLRRRLTFA